MAMTMDDERNRSRRRVLELFVNGVLAAIAGALASIVGVFAVNPTTIRPRQRWIRAASLVDIEPGTPQAVVVAVPRESGWHRTRSRQVIYVTWDGEKAVAARAATCTHLGCLVKWDSSAEQFRCPCHGGAYDEQGNVIAGPPPRPLERVDARIEVVGSQPTLMVRV